MTVHAYATEAHFARRLAPVWATLPDGVKGWFAVPPSIEGYARSLGADRVRWARGPSGDAVMVASGGDMRRQGRRPVALLEHGAGQTYAKPHPSYAGGPGRNMVGLFVCQSHRVAAANEAAWPGRRYAVAGDPALDGLHRSRTPGRLRLTVALAFHWDCPMVPETRSAWRHYRDLAPLLETARDNGWTVVGHGHPRIIDSHLRPWYRSLGVEVVDTAEEVLARADVLCADNTSLMYEAAAAGVPVVAMNAPWYRRDVHHGLRFWSLVPGPQADGPDDLPAAVASAAAGEWDTRRERIADRVYANRDGSAAEAAAAAIVAWDADGHPIGGPAMPEPDRSEHDPYAPKTRSGGPGPARGQRVAPRRRGPEPAPATVDTASDEQPDGVPEGYREAIEWIDAARDDASEAMRARAVWDAELQRSPSDRRVTVRRRVAEVLDDVDPDEPDADGDDEGEGDGDG